MPNVDIVKERVPFNWGQFTAILFFAISTTFTLTKIYDRFEAVETQQQIDRSYFEEEILRIETDMLELDANQTRRLDTKTKRNSDAIEKIKNGDKN